MEAAVHPVVGWRRRWWGGAAVGRPCSGGVGGVEEAVGEGVEEAALQPASPIKLAAVNVCSVNIVGREGNHSTGLKAR